MAPGFFTEPLLIKQLLADPFLFEAPSYQRAYSWTPDEAGQLLDDVQQAMLESVEGEQGLSGYFLGSILLVDAQAHTAAVPDGLPSSGKRRVFEIIDGLQRLVTLTTLFCVLRDLDHQEGRQLARKLESFVSLPDEARRFRLKLCGSGSDFLQDMVQRPGASAEMPLTDELTEGEQRLLKVREFFAAELWKLSDDQRQSLADFILEECALAVIVTRNIDRAHRMFSVLNERGMPLARSDIFKADILGAMPPAQRAEAAKVWEDVARQLGPRFDSLFSHIRVIYGKQNVQIIDGIRKIAKEVGNGQRFIQEIMLPMARTYDLLLNPASAHELYATDPEAALQIERSLFYLGWLKGADWVPPAMRWVEFNADEPQRIAEFLTALERYSYAMRVLGIGRKKRLQRYGAVLSWIADNKGAAELSGLPMSFSLDEQRHILRNLRNLHSRNQQICKLVLMRLSADMAARAGIEERFDPADFTVEHVLPQKPPSGGQWRKWFPNADDRAKCIAGLGNLVLVTKAQNQLAGRGEFADKQKVYFSEETQVAAKLTDSLRGLKCWKPDLVRERDRRMTNRLKLIWKIELA